MLTHRRSSKLRLFALAFALVAGLTIALGAMLSAAQAAPAGTHFWFTGGSLRHIRSMKAQEEEEENGILSVLVVDAGVDFRQAFAALLEGQPDLEVVGQAGSLDEARKMLEGIDVAFIDRDLPDGDGLRLLGPLREANPDVKTFMMSLTAERRHFKDAIEAGADGVIDKLEPFERVFAAIRDHGGG
jgi:CheY-like chemotaxis protein